MLFLCSTTQHHGDLIFGMTTFLVIQGSAHKFWVFSKELQQRITVMQVLK